MNYLNNPKSTNRYGMHNGSVSTAPLKPLDKLSLNLPQVITDFLRVKLISPYIFVKHKVGVWEWFYQHGRKRCCSLPRFGRVDQPVKSDLRDDLNLSFMPFQIYKNLYRIKLLLFTLLLHWLANDLCISTTTNVVKYFQ